MSDDIREALEGALEEQVQPESIEEQEEALEEQVDIEDVIEAEEARERDEQGRFKKKEEVEEVVAEEEVKPAVEEPLEGDVIDEVPAQPAFEAPQSYSAAVKEKWADVPPEVQAEISKRENDIHRMMTSHDGELRMGREMKDVINPYMPLIQSMGTTPTQAVQEVMNVAYLLNTGQPHQKAELINSLIQKHQIDMRMIPEQGDVDPQIQSLKQQIAHLSEAANPQVIEQKLRTQMEQERINQEVQAFAADPANVHFDKVKGFMSALLDSGQAQDMQQAYEMACRADPEIHSTLEQQKAKEAEAKRKQEITAKKNAAASVTGSPDRTVNSSPKTHKSTRAELEAQWDELSSASI